MLIAQTSNFVTKISPQERVRGQVSEPSRYYLPDGMALYPQVVDPQLPMCDPLVTRIDVSPPIAKNDGCCRPSRYSPWMT